MGSEGTCVNQGYNGHGTHYAVGTDVVAEEKGERNMEYDAYQRDVGLQLDGADAVDEAYLQAIPDEDREVDGQNKGHYHRYLDFIANPEPVG